MPFRSRGAACLKNASSDNKGSLVRQPYSSGISRDVKISVASPGCRFTFAYGCQIYEELAETIDTEKGVHGVIIEGCNSACSASRRLSGQIEILAYVPASLWSSRYPRSPYLHVIR